VTVQQVLRHRRVRYWSRLRIKIFAWMSVIPLGLGILFFWAAASKYYPNAPKAAPPLLEIAFGTFWILFGLILIARAILPVLVMTTHTLRQPKLLGLARVTPLDQVTGVGLVYERSVGAPTPGGWYLYIWTTGDIPWSVGIGYSPRRLHSAGNVRQKLLAVDPTPAEQGRPFDPYTFSYHFNPVTQTDPRKLAATHPARVACEIYDRVLAYQGPSGYLAVRQDQKHVPIMRNAAALENRPLSSAYWSPDGDLGYPKFALHPQPAGTAVPANLQRRPKGPGPLRHMQHRARLVGRKFQRRSGDIRSDIIR
jgi:hypothetical protein